MTNVLQRSETDNRNDPLPEPPREEKTFRQLGAGRTRIKINWLATETGLVILGSCAAALIVGWLANWSQQSLRSHLGYAFLGTPIWVLMLVRQRLYQARHISTRLQEWRRLLNAAATATLLTLAAGALLDDAQFSRGWAIGSTVLVLALLMLERELVRRSFSKARRTGRMLRDVVIVGTNEDAETIRKLIDADPELGYRFVGYIAESEDEDLSQPDVLGPISKLEVIVEDAGIDNVILAGGALEPQVVKTTTRALVSRGVHIEISPMLPDTSIERVTVHQLGPHPMMYIEPAEQSGTSAVFKRAFDLIFSVAILIVTAPILLLVAIAIKIDSRGPVLFAQERVGHHGRTFRILKFRSMVTDAEERKKDLEADSDSAGPLFKMTSDPRVTKVGKFIRRTALDELPQFFNVLRGDMSVVGPRPALASEVAEWPEDLHHRLRARPGITGMWQVMGEDRHDFDQYSKLDLYYVDNWSLFTDLSIVLRTVPSILTREGD